ncbi:MAG TPA: carbon storage regulator [Syntrophorhabdaceae bacterium]|nr:carbon storage regulator [Syntrophorhabdaceae bacterium]HON85628.1 carbon storage regulator [Syntrophorhabdaceae bacterium]HOT41960.1 carbon storage regulator [Syntrophorhabdaceae bacterium]HPC67025.1 carbon storage regulator [Syntrophorhabdaceae bacterium]HQE79892.1 carbon storage regulator [Syntrophorhabdaceae bacterium]
MLVLTRKKNEGIIIKGRDGDIRVFLIDAEKGKVRIGIEAPRGYTIIREELLSEIEGANRLSAIDNLERIKKFIGEGSE